MKKLKNENGLPVSHNQKCLANKIALIIIAPCQRDMEAN